MKTLDEVINIFEKACDLERRCEDCSGCLGQEEGCPNDGANAVPDALHYLKEYREKLNILEIRMAEYKRGFEQLGVEWARIKDNPALTWDELRQMEGKPVWVEYLKDGESYDAEWIIIQDINDECMGDTQRFAYQKLDYSDTWQAYRKER